jgi:predicted aspartyl protease
MPRTSGWPLPALVITMLALPTSGSASVTPTAQRIIDRYLEGTGGLAALDSLRSVHVKGHIHSMRLNGRFEQWTLAPDRLVMRVVLGPLNLMTGYDGRVGWRTDLSSKKVTRLDGKELESIRADAYFENEMWARPDQGGGTIQNGTSSYRDDDQLLSIDVKPPVGRGRRLWFNRKSGLLVHMTVEHDGGTEERWFSEHRLAAGRKRAMLRAEVAPEFQRVVDEVREEEGAEQMVVDSVWASARIDTALFSMPISRVAGTRWLKASGLARIPFRYGTHHLWVKASINGHPPADFLIDTGCSITAIDRAYADEIGLHQEGEMRVQGMGGSSGGAFARVGTVKVTSKTGDGVEVKDLRAAIVDMGDDQEAVLWRRMGGLIGSDVLSRFVVDIDYDQRIVTLRDPVTFKYQGRGQPIPMGLVMGIPTVRASLDSTCEGVFIVDVGNGFGLDVHGSMVRTCRIFSAVTGRKQVQVYGGGIGDGFVSWLTRLDRMQIGPYEWKEPIAGLSLSTQGMVGSEDYSGNIGNRVLDKFRVTFDYARSLLYLEPGQRYGERDHYSRCGAMFIKLGEKVVAEMILHGSAADEAGLKPHEEVIAIDGKPILGFTPEDLDRLFEDGAKGTEHTVTVKRKSKRVDLSLKLDDVL